MTMLLGLVLGQIGALGRIEQLVGLAETATRAARAVRDLRKAGNNEAANMLQQECDKACQAIVKTAQRRRNAAAKARSQRRNNGRFS